MAANPIELNPKLILTNNIETIKFDLELSYNKFTDRSLDYYDSKTVSLPCKVDPQFFLRMYPNKSNIVYLYFRLHQSMKPVTIKSSVWMLDGQRKKFGIVNKVLKLSQGGEDYIFSKLRSEVLHATNGLLQEDKITFYCEFAFTIEVNSEKVLLVPDQIIEKHAIQQQIIDGLDGLYQSGKFFDVTIVVGDREFLAHKAILALRSSVFACMLDEAKKTKESKEGRVVIPDIEPDIFEYLLLFIYTGKISNLEQDVTCALLAAADKYQLDSLKAVCEESLCTQISAHSVHSLLMLADLHSAAKLKAVALEYFRKNTQQVLESMFHDNKTEQLLKAFRDLAPEPRDG